MKNYWAICLLASIFPGVGRPAAGLPVLDRNMPGPRAEVLVLGTVHLAETPEEFRLESLAPIVDRLVAFKPEVVTVEELSGPFCDSVARYPTIYDPEDVRRFCADTAAAKAATGLDVPAAVAEAAKTLKAWPARPTPAQRRHLAALFMAANDPTSAFVQWLQLSSAERRVGEGLDEALVTRLKKRETSRSESDQIAARVAARLGLQRVFQIDDHSGDNIDVADPGAFGKTQQQAWDSARAQSQPMRKHEGDLEKKNDALALYRYINDAHVRGMDAESDFGASLREKSPQQYGRIYVAGWETRNLRMVANIREAFREKPGARVLSIVGAQHKLWFEGLLGQMQGVEIVDAEQVLK